MGRTDPNTTIPELKGLAWDDTYFDKTDDNTIIAVFDFDYEKIADFQTSVTTTVLLCPCVGIPSLLCCVPCFFKQNIHWKTYAQHVAITQDGIRYVTEEQKSGCGFDFQDQGKNSKTVPFDKITDCDVTEPAGATCFCIQNVLSVLNVDTASGARVGGDGLPEHELSLAGLKKPNEMKKLVWAMKRHGGGGGGGVAHHQQASANISSGAPPYVTGGMDRGDGNAETNAILREIRDELKDLNKHLRDL